MTFQERFDAIKTKLDDDSLKGPDVADVRWLVGNVETLLDPNTAQAIADSDCEFCDKIRKNLCKKCCQGFVWNGLSA